jgi:putative ABC transport system permease protein
VSIWRQVTRGVHRLTHRAASDRDDVDEVQHYFEQAAASLMARGLSSGDARRAAHHGAGNLTTVREAIRGYGWENTISTILGDMRYALRRLRGSPGFTITTVLTLAVGIGATTAIFGAVKPVLLEGLPYPEPGRLVMLSDRDEAGAQSDVTFGTYREVLARSHSFAALAVAKSWQPTLTGRADPERPDGQRVSASYFRVLGMVPLLGRDFDAADDRPQGSNVIIISNGFWRRRFGGDPGIIGRQVTLDDDRYTVIGVMPPGFASVLAPAAELWSLLQYDASLPAFQDPARHESREWGHHLTMVGRLLPAASVDRATREIAQIARTTVPEFVRPEWASLAGGLIVHPLQQDVTSLVEPSLLAMAGAVLLVLMIACVNVTNLLLGRVAQRQGELAMRAALGAGRSRIVRQLLTESVLLAAIGGVLGLIVAEAGVRTLVALSPPELPRADAIRVDAAVLAFAIGVTTVVGLVVGLLPALRGIRSDVHSGLRPSPRAPGSQRAARGILVVAEVALALVLLVSAGLLLRSLERLVAVPPGFDASGLLTMQVQIFGHQYDDSNARYRFLADALDAVRRVRGVGSAAFTSQLPLSGEIDGYGVRLESSHRRDGIGEGSALRYAASPGYVQAMGIQLRRGRLLDEHDAAGHPAALLVSESFARHNFPGTDPIGQRLRFGPDTSWETIVGIVDDVKQTSLAAGQTDAVYVTTSQWLWVDSRLSLVVRATGDPAALASAVKAAIWSVDKDRPIVQVATMDALLARSASGRRFALAVFEAFGILALALAAIGLYGVISGSVTERLREIGVRMALGASPADILGGELRQGMALIALGVVIGLPGAVAASRAIAALLFEVSPLDPISYVRVVAVLVIVSAIACWLPARRAAGGDPLIALRTD